MNITHIFVGLHIYFLFSASNIYTINIRDVGRLLLRADDGDTIPGICAILRASTLDSELLCSPNSRENLACYEYMYFTRMYMKRIYAMCIHQSDRASGSSAHLGRARLRGIRCGAPRIYNKLLLRRAEEPAERARTFEVGGARARWSCVVCWTT